MVRVERGNPPNKTINLGTPNQPVGVAHNHPPPPPLAGGGGNIPPHAPPLKGGGIPIPPPPYGTCPPFAVGNIP